MGVALGIIGVAMGAIGTGLQYSASMSAARTQEQFSNLNAMAGMQQATQQANQQMLQSELQSAQSQTAQRSATENAEAARNQSELERRMAQEDIRRSHEDFRRKFAAMSAQAGGSGVDVGTMSPLENLFRASEEQMAIESDMNFVANNSRTESMRRAAAINLGGRVEGLNASLFTLQGESQLAEGRMRAAQARLDGLAGRAQAQGMRNQAFGAAVSGIASTAFSGAQLWQNRPGYTARTARPSTR